jgi:mRNA-degrading endonuclease YafQ of YafQ-DinJ toxin-antitoxin module
MKLLNKYVFQDSQFLTHRSKAMAILRMSNIFAESANHLPKEAKTKLLKVFVLLTDNPRHPSLQLKKIQGASRKDVYECRIDQFWRIVLKEVSEMTFDLIYVGAHDEAISYGARLREARVEYGLSASIENRLEFYLVGNDEALEFTAVTLSELARLAS